MSIRGAKGIFPCILLNHKHVCLKQRCYLKQVVSDKIHPKERRFNSQKVNGND